jgi:hypothetical protein
MRKTLLIAAAALAASVISSEAQVYSQNIVGYANLPTTGGGTYLMTVPFQVGSSNGANEIWPNGTIPDGSILSIWTGTKYIGYQSDSGSSSLWDDSGGNPIPNAPLLPVGTGFFLIPAGTFTNTFAGSVAVNVGTSNVVTLAGGSTDLVAPKVPYAGAVTNGDLTTGVGGACMWNNGTIGIPDGTILSVWTGTKYIGYQSDSGSSSYWDDSGGNPILVPPSINVGQGFFVIPAANWNWTVGL